MIVQAAYGGVPLATASSAMEDSFLGATVQNHRSGPAAIHVDDPGLPLRPVVGQPAS